jgi:PAS domain S-box-containing protein
VTRRRVVAGGAPGALDPALRAALDAVSQPVLVLSAGKVVELLHANPAFFKATRLKPPDKPGPRGLATWLTADAERRLLEAMERAKKGGTAAHVERDLFNMPADLQWLTHGSRRYCVATLVAQSHGAGPEPPGPELKRLSAQLMTAMELEGMAAWTWHADTDWIKVDFRGSQATRLMQAGSLKELLERMSEADRTRAERAMRTAMHGPGVSRIEINMNSADGTPRWFSMAAQRYLDETGSPAGLAGVTRDITTRKVAFQKLAESEERLRAILEAEPECVEVVDGSGILRLVNPAGLAMLEADEADQVLDRPISEFIVPEYREAFAAMHRRAMAGATGMLEMETEGRRGGRRFVESHCAPLRDNQGSVIAALAVVRDVSERHQLAGEIIAAASREQERIGHDLHDGLGQELTGIALLLTGLLGRLDQPTAELRRELTDILGLVRGAVQGTRALAHGLSPVAVERGGLAEALRALVSRLRERSGLSMRFTSRGWLDERLAPANALQLYRIAQEALNNVLRHAEARRVAVTLSMTGAGARLRIVDDGRGIDTMDPSGTGLGLKIMAYRARMVSAQLDVTPRPGGGTVVSVACPCGLARRRRRRDDR